MNPAAPPATGAHAALYQRVIKDVLAHSGHLLEHVIESTRQSLQTREDLARTPGERHSVMDARQHLTRLTFVLCDRFPAALQQALAEGAVQKQKSTRSLFAVHFDELELMDETQINESVERARAGQVVAEAVQSPLADLNALLSAAQGQATVSADHNPLHPQLFLQALQTVVGQMQVSEQVRRDWMWHLAQALGDELRVLYLELIDRLQDGGIQPAGYAVRQASGDYVYMKPTGPHGHAPGFGPETAAGPIEDASASASPGPQAATVAHDESLLTLDRLRRLLAGELSDTPSPMPEESFAERFSREFEGPDSLADTPPPDFDITVPAAFEALQEMNQVSHMVQRLGAQRQPGTPDATPNPGSAGRDAMRSSATGLGQALSLEVVALMVDNIAHDGRLLWPVQQLVKELEPALLQLALADPRFFSDKEHPARRLLQEMTDRSLAFDSLESHGFESFMQPLIDVARPLANAHIDSKEPFEHALEQLLATWAEREQQRARERLQAIETLRRAEQRNLLAAKMVRDLWLLPQIDHVPKEIHRFLEGPWAQVMAQARLTDDSGSNDPGRYRELVDALLWSAQPEQTRINVGRLARLVPKLLSKLREGLATIDYPATKTAAFFDLLMKLHQQAFRPAPASARPSAPPPPSPPRNAPARDAEEPWIAPSEAQQSGFMDVGAEPGPGEAQATTAEASGDSFAPADAQATGEARSADLQGMTIGTWVDLLVSGKWERTQLSWIGPHGTLFLFTSAYGRTQSMTKRLLDKLVAQGSMRVISQQTVVEGALDAVAEAALRNSVDIRL